nr:retron St85 family RNA-directed DNA polymerase [uncultured Pantoea sp.]
MIETNQELYTQRLLALPIIQSIEDLSTRTRLPVSLISQYLGDNSRYYFNIHHKKKTGGMRSINSPNRQLKALQRWILKNILEKLKPSRYAKGFIPKLNLLDNAQPHAGNQYVLKIDFKDFFPSIEANKVYSIFRAVGYSKKISYYLTSICTLKGYLPQGAPSSPYLSNLVCIRIDHRIGRYCDKYALIYTRYADDISISGNQLSSIKKSWLIIKMIISEEGFIINKSKELLSGPRSSRIVTGLVTNPTIGIGRKKYNHYRKEIFNLKRNGSMSHIEKITGILSFVKSVDIKRYEQLKKYYETI